MAGEIYLSNLSGQFDYQQILDKYQQLKFQQISIIQQKEEKVLQQKSAFSTYANMLEGFKNSFEKVVDPTLLDKKIVTVSDESVATVSINDATKVNPTKLDFTVTQLARNDVWLSQGGVSNKSDAVATNDGTLTISIGGNDYSIDYTSDDTLQDIADKINQATDKVNASIFFDGTNYRLIVSAKETGTDNVIDFDDSGDLLDNLQLGSDYDDSHVQSAQNAQIDIYGQVVQSQTNTFTNVIDGIDITVKRLSSDPIEIEIDNDDEAIKDALEELFDAYNALVDYANEQTKEGAALSGDFTLHSIRSALFQRLTPLLDESLVEIDHANGHISLRTDRFDQMVQNEKDSLKETFEELKSQLQPYLDALFDSQGLLEQKEESYDRQIRRYEDDIAFTANRVNQEIENLKRQFIYLDGLMAQFNDMKTQIAAILPKDQK